MRSFIKAAVWPRTAQICTNFRARTAANRHGVPIRWLSRNLPATPALQAYPLPDVQLLMNDMHDAIKPFYPQSKLNEYKSAVSTLFGASNNKQTAVSQAIQGVIQNLDNRENWADVYFSDLLLSTRLPLSMIAKVSVKLQMPDKQWSQVDSAAHLLRAVAIWRSDSSFKAEHGASALTKSQKLVAWQMEEFHGFRYPVKGKDEVRPGGEGDFAVVWRKGWPFRVEFRCDVGILGIDAIREQITQILAWEPTGEVSAWSTE